MGRDNKRRGEGGRGGGGPNKKSKYLAPRGGGNNQALPHGSRGILVTSDSGREDRTADELIPIIEEHYDKLLAAGIPEGAVVVPSQRAGASGKEGTGEEGGKAKEQEERQPAAAAGGEGGSKDISALIAAEVKDLKDKKKHRFHLHQTGVKGCFYVSFPDEPAWPGPADVTVSICEEAAATKTLRGRHVNRLLPVTHTCFAGMEEVKALAPKVTAPFFPAEDGAASIEFAVEYEHRSADKFDRMEVINALVHTIKCPPHKVNLKSPALTIIIQMTRNSCGLAVVPKYRELNKFNLRKCAEVEEEGDKQPAPAPAAQAAPAAAEPAKAETAEAEAKEAGKAEAAPAAAADAAPEGEKKEEDTAAKAE